MNRRQFLTTASAALVSTVDATARAAAGHTKRPNVIFAFSDEHRRASMSFTGMPQLHTQNMARMAAEGFEFTRCISNYPVCSPYRAMLQTGLWPQQSGVTDNDIPLDASRANLGTSFQAAGYRTCYIGKWHLGGVRAEPYGYDQSFVWTGTGTHFDKADFHPSSGEPQHPQGYNATIMTNQAIAFMEEPDPKPFFVMISWDPPHSSFLDAPEEKKRLYSEGSLPYPPNVSFTEGADKETSPGWAKFGWPTYQGYHAHISAIDDELGRLMRFLDERNLTDNTIVIYTSDHGSMMGSHGLGGKRQPYEESIRVPFLVRWPGVVPAGRRSDSLFGTIDILPTLCSLAGVTPRHRCSGENFSPTVLGRRGPQPRFQPIMHMAKEHASGGENHPAPLFRGVRSDRYTFAAYHDGGGCLFDNKDDPHQMINLCDSPEARSLQKRLRTMTQLWLDKLDDPFRLG